MYTTVPQEQKLSYYINTAKSLDTNLCDKKIRIAFLGSFTLNGLEETIRVKCAQINVNCATYVSNYKQYNQEMLDGESNLYKFNPDVSFLILDTRTILGNLYYFPYAISVTERITYIDKQFDNVINLIKSYTSKSKSKLIVSNIQVPVYSPYGIYETKMSNGLYEIVKQFNSKLMEFVKTQDSVYLYNFSGFVSYFGEQNIFDYKQFFYGDIKISLDYIPYLANDVMGYVKAILGLNKKCIVLDLDNTLWGGIVGEDGFDGIRLGSDPIGKTFIEFQNILLALHQKGVILAINSKNNLDDAMQVIKKHPDMVIKEENFSCIKINWNDKVTNMQEIANELNIGLDSMVFFDDDPINREYVRLNLPQVTTVELPMDSALYAQTLMSMNDFHLLKVTDEDISRGEMYLHDQQRKNLEHSATNVEEFLRQLEIKLTIRRANNFTIPRISQLTLKTNQFNLTTRRYQEEEIKKFANDHKYLIGCAQVQDKFGDNGITGVFIIQKENNLEWFIDTFLLSCRVMGRGVEEGMLSYVLQKAKENGVKKIKGEFIATKKNKPSENFYLNYGFKQDGKYWVYDLDNKIKIPNHLSLSEEK